MSKQSNQRYRKEKESEHLKKAGMGESATGSGQSRDLKGKINHEFPVDRLKP
jgi:hypothetical protein